MTEERLGAASSLGTGGARPGQGTGGTAGLDNVCLTYSKPAKEARKPAKEEGAWKSAKEEVKPGRSIQTPHIMVVKWSDRSPGDEAHSR